MAQYIPHMIISQSNWDYNKHFQVKFGAYLQASQVNYPNNKNCRRTLDGIFLCPVPNLQGGHQIMNMWTRQLIIRKKVVEIPVTDDVINSVEKWRNGKDLSH